MRSVMGGLCGKCRETPMYNDIVAPGPGELRAEVRKCGRCWASKDSGHATTANVLGARIREGYVRGMNVPQVPTRLIGLLLCVWVSACSAPRPATFPAEEELTQHLLVLRASPEGGLTHSWERADAAELARYRAALKSRSPHGRIVRVSHAHRDCDAENLECVRQCMSRPLARGFGHITAGGRGKGGKEEFCESQCARPYRDCMDLQRLRLQKFSATDEAVDWLMRNRGELVLGSVVIIAGVVFVTVSAGTGLIVLAPAVLMAS